MNAPAGRTCPIAYRYGAQALRRAPEQVTTTLYVIGGLYGNLPALDAILEMAAREPSMPTLCFNGDFNWFNVDDAGFLAINQVVLAHDATLGNVEAELFSVGDDAGCGCAYPDHVDAVVVDRSNRIHARLKRTAQRYPELVERLARLHMVRRYRVGDCAIGIVHGDADSLSGWRFDLEALDNSANRSWIDSAFAEADVDVFASTHTCVPVLRHFANEARPRLVINNGAAGMPNFRGDLTGLVTRIGIHRSPHPALYGAKIAETYVDALPVDYDQVRWQKQFLGNWPPASAAHLSYFSRITEGPDHLVRRASLSAHLPEHCA
jgi:hypothetical protein